jgi:hypothetical protein
VELDTSALARPREGKKRGVSGGPEAQKFGHETGRKPSGVASSVMKYARDGIFIRIRKAVTRFREGGSQTRPAVLR